MKDQQGAEEALEQPMGGLSANELSALAAILQLYERHLWNSMAPSVKRSRQQVEITAIMVKLCLLPVGKASVLIDGEIAYLEAALMVFLCQVEEKMPLSDNRAGILASCHQLREGVAALLEATLPKQAEEQ